MCAHQRASWFVVYREEEEEGERVSAVPLAGIVAFPLYALLTRERHAMSVAPSHKLEIVPRC